MQAKQKKCSGCGELKHIWKRHNRNLYCKDCWAQHPDKSKKPLQAKKPMSKKSSKQDKLDVLYSVLRENYMKANPFCKAKLPGCQINATDVHHKAGRVGDNYLKIGTWLSTCRTCHTWIENNPESAKELGLSESRLTPP